MIKLETIKKSLKYDIHCHTTNSDGSLSTKELLSLASKKNLEFLAITDHNSVEAYFDMKKFDVKKHFKGKILTGCEMDAYFEGKPIEILAYGIDVEMLKQEMKAKTNFEWIKKKRDAVLEQLKQIAKELGLKFDPNLKMINYKMGECGTFFRHLKQFEENKKHFKEDIWNNPTKFFRDEVSNIKSPFFIDYSQYYNTPKQVVDTIHKCGGKAFLAHFFIYGFEDTQATLEKFVAESGVDGLECYYPTFKEEEVLFILNFCKQNKLLISGGSDFHGPQRPESVLGVPHHTIEVDSTHLAWLDNALSNQKNFLK